VLAGYCTVIGNKYVHRAQGDRGLGFKSRISYKREFTKTFVTPTTKQRAASW
jgi:hypothetical protein